MYLNQLMSFSAVAAPALMALKQTKQLSQLLDKFWGLLDVISLPVEAGTGQLTCLLKQVFQMGSWFL